MKFELEKKYIEMEVSKVGDKWVVGKNPRVRDGRVHKDGSVAKYVTCRLYGQYMNNLSYTDREHRFEIKDRDKYIKTGIEDVNHQKIDRCKISFPLPLNAVDFSKYDDKVVVDIPDNFRLTVYAQLPEGVKVKGENNHNALKLYNVRMKDILDGRATPPKYLLFSEQMIMDTQYKSSYVKWMEGSETKQILIDQDKITQNAEEMKQRLKRVKIYPNRMYKVSSFSRSTDEQGNPLWNEEGRAVYTKTYENDGKPLKGADIIKRIRDSKEQYKDQINVQNKEPKKKEFEQESLFDKKKTVQDFVNEMIEPLKADRTNEWYKEGEEAYSGMVYDIRFSHPNWFEYNEHEDYRDLQNEADKDLAEMWKNIKFEAKNTLSDDEYNRFVNSYRQAITDESLFDHTNVRSEIDKEIELERSTTKEHNSMESTPDQSADPLNMIKMQLMSNKGWSEEEANKFTHSFAGLLNQISRDDSAFDVFNASLNNTGKQQSQSEEDRAIEKDDGDIEL